MALSKMWLWVGGAVIGGAALWAVSSSDDSGDAGVPWWGGSSGGGEGDSITQTINDFISTTGGAMAAVIDGPSFAKKMWTVLSDAFPTMGLETKLIIIAHGGYESGWGQKAAIKQGAANDMFNITAGTASSTKYWNGQRLTVQNADYTYLKKGAAQPDSSWEWDAGMSQWRKRIAQTWRVYPDYETAVRDYYDFLGPGQNNGRYVAARNALDAGDAVTFAQELGKAGYYDINIMDAYTSSLSNVVNTVKKFLGVA